MPELAQAGTLTSVDEVLSLIDESVRAVGTEPCELAAAVGRILREPARAANDEPAFDRSAVDGFLVRHEDAAEVMAVVGEIRAGDWPTQRVEYGQAMQIGTGAALPGEGWRVIMREHVTVEPGRGGPARRIRILHRDPRRHIRFRGEDARAGQEVMAAGTRLHPGGLACLAACGMVRPQVTRPIRVLHVATGNELVDPALEPGPGHIRDSNSTLVAAFLKGWPVELVQLRLPEDEAAAWAAVSEHLAAATAPFDLLLMSGGASVGPHDFSAQLMGRLGCEIMVERVAVRPGKPFLLAQSPWGWAVGLPGNPISHLVALNVFVRALLDRLSGLKRLELFEIGRLVTALIPTGGGRETFWPGQYLGLRAAVGRANLLPCAWSGSGDPTALAATALIRLPAGLASLRADAEAQFVRLN